MIHMKNEVIRHYDLLIDEGNDPVLDSPDLQEYMNQWDGQVFVELLKLDKTTSVLEIGCGTGRLAVRVAPNVKSFCGIDFSSKTVATAKKHLPFPNVTLICDDFLEYDFKETFDVIYASLTFLHIENKEKAISIVSKLLNENGRFILSIDKNTDNVFDYGTRCLKTFPDSPSHIKALLTKYRFQNIEMHETKRAYIFACVKPSN